MLSKEFIKTTLLYDIQYHLSDKKINNSIGFESMIFDQFLLRIGYFSNNVQNQNYFTIGSGYKINDFGFDFSMLIGNENILVNNTFQFSLLYNIN